MDSVAVAAPGSSGKSLVSQASSRRSVAPGETPKVASAASTSDGGEQGASADDAAGDFGHFGYRIESGGGAQCDLEHRQATVDQCNRKGLGDAGGLLGHNCFFQKIKR
jgi:hypothetical protein